MSRVTGRDGRWVALELPAEVGPDDDLACVRGHTGDWILCRWTPYPAPPRRTFALVAPVTRLHTTLHLWMHTCGHADWFDVNLPPNGPPPEGALGGCDACDSGSDDPAEWQQLYVKVNP